MIVTPPSHNKTVARCHKQITYSAMEMTCDYRRKKTGTHFFLKDKYNSLKRYKQHISNIREWAGPVLESPPTTKASAPERSDIEIGDLALVRED